MLKLLAIFCLNIYSVVMLRHKQPLAETLWSEHCLKNSYALNDCNWCSCNKQSRYTCKARDCGEVDMFGHFNDAIQEMDVGMEGHGVWRTSATACEPGVHYTRDETLCVCTGDGNWPSPVCRDIFQVMHTVEITNYTRPEKNQECSPMKLHLIGCNVCFCPSSGYINSKFCTDRQCHEEIPDTHSEIHNNYIEEIYANCRPEKKYSLGCKNCICLRNNRLLCDNCTEENIRSVSQRTTSCRGRKPGVPFSIDCRACVCNQDGKVYCTSDGCEKERTQKSPQNDESSGRSDCVPGSVWKEDCNRCKCMDDGKSVTCTTKRCLSKDIELDLIPVLAETSCSAGQSYKLGCNYCFCMKNGNSICTTRKCTENK